MLDLNKIKLDLQVKLSEYRYAHSLRTAEEAKKLAKYYNIDENDAYVAGLLHDVAKEFNCEKNKLWIKRYNLSDELLDIKNKKICHAEIGAVVAKEIYGISEKIAQAIKYHTIGNVEMNIFDKVIFVADKIESGKSYPGIIKERKLAYQNIDDAMIECLKNQKEKLTNEGKPFNKESEKLLKLLLLNKSDY